MEETERAAKGSEAGTSTEKDVVAEEVVGDETDIPEKEDIVEGKNFDTVVGDDVDIEEGADDKPNVTVDTEGETPKSVLRGKPLLSLLRGEPLLLIMRGKTAEKIVEGETSVKTEELDSGGLQTIVDLVNEPESEETPADERLIRRRTRQRRILDEVDEPTRPRELDFGAQRERAGVGGDIP